MTEGVDYEILEPETFMGPKRYRITTECPRCLKPYRWTTVNVARADPPCPRKACIRAAAKEQALKEQANMAQVIDEQRAPAHTGANNAVRAVDMTSEMVMRDYNMTNLKDNIREGETMAPPLQGTIDTPQGPVSKQSVADGFFGGGLMRGRKSAARVAATRAVVAPSCISRPTSRLSSNEARVKFTEPR